MSENIYVEFLCLHAYISGVPMSDYLQSGVPLSEYLHKWRSCLNTHVVT